MKNTKLFALLVVVSTIALFATACTAKAKETAAVPAAAATVSIDLMKVTDPASFATASSAVAAQYADVTAKIAAGDTTLTAQSAELVTLAAGLDAAAVTIKATLKDQALLDFTAAADAFKALFATPSVAVAAEGAPAK